ncbi:hypothetical protein Taro_038268 [Colocasia esculenta]|uniref:Uncharacterized protein n=1 Tax=Colocasia esculenta TaxID=4460 RepID=A0A843W7R7_COLES|nr:hypothetical protein [Colocasia esculenta]
MLTRAQLLQQGRAAVAAVCDRRQQLATDETNSGRRHRLSIFAGHWQLSLWSPSIALPTVAAAIGCHCCRQSLHRRSLSNCYGGAPDHSNGAFMSGRLNIKYFSSIIVSHIYFSLT